MRLVEEAGPLGRDDIISSALEDQHRKSIYIMLELRLFLSSKLANKLPLSPTTPPRGIAEVRP